MGVSRLHALIVVSVTITALNGALWLVTSRKHPVPVVLEDAVAAVGDAVHAEGSVGEKITADLAVHPADVDAGHPDAGQTFDPLKKPKAILHTKHGTITFELEPQAAPKTVANFIKNARSGLMNGSACFYRYEKGFVLQGGICSGKSGAHVPLEYKLPNVKYSVALARTSNPNSGGSEFFINLRDNSAGLGPKKKGGYAVFAHVIDGFDTIAAMKKLPTVKGRLTMFKPNVKPKIRFVEIIDG